MLKNFKIGTRLGIGFGVIFALMVAVILIGVSSMSKMSDSTMHIVERNYERIKHTREAQDLISLVYWNIADMTLASSVDDAKVHMKNVGEIREQYRAKIEELEKEQTHPEVIEMYRRLEEAISDAADSNNAVMRLCVSGKFAEGQALFDRESKDHRENIFGRIEEIVKYEDERITVRYKETTEAYDTSFTLMLVIGGIALAAVIGLSMLLTRGITRPLNEAVMVAGRVADGDLTAAMDSSSRDEVGALGAAVNKMVTNLRDMVGTVNASAAQVAAAADQVNTSSKQIEKGAQVQASAADETSASMEQMAASIQMVAINAHDLASNVDETSASINQMVASIEQVAKNAGIMAASVQETSATIEQMAVSIDNVAKDTENLSASVEETSATVEQMMASIDQVARNSDMLSGTVAETSTTIEEMAASIQLVAKNVSEADSISRQAAQDAKAGGEAVEQTIEGIGRIAETMKTASEVIGSLGRRSEEIGKIVGVIEDIADQTNLLALNAAIEAARAGDAGRGFAVVADEVRKLAERSVVATKEIGEVIKQVQSETAHAVKTAEMGASETVEGKKLADKAGAALKRILDSVGATNTIMADINNASREQATAAAQVLKAVENMNQATDQVISAVKEQSMGSNQIRKAVETMNRTTRQVAGAMREQAAGGKQIRVAVEDINRLTGQVNTAAKEQAAGTAQIMRAVENMNNMTQQVAGATAEQKRGGELVVQAVENISDVARENLGAVRQMASSAENISFQAESLQRAISVFKINQMTMNCWDILHCANESRYKCPAYQNPEKRCWLIEGTWCKGVKQGDARSKLANCMHCEAFKVMQGSAYLPGREVKGIEQGLGVRG